MDMRGFAHSVIFTFRSSALPHRYISFHKFFVLFVAFLSFTCDYVYGVRLGQRIKSALRPQSPAPCRSKHSINSTCDALRSKHQNKTDALITHSFSPRKNLENGHLIGSDEIRRKSRKTPRENLPTKKKKTQIEKEIEREREK